MADNKQHDTRTARRPDCVTEIRMGNSVLVVSGYFKKDTTTTAADKMARVLEAEAAATQEPGHRESGHAGECGRWNISDNFIFFGVLRQCLYWQLYPVTALR